MGSEISTLEQLDYSIGSLRKEYDLAIACSVSDEFTGIYLRLLDLLERMRGWIEDIKVARNFIKGFESILHSVNGQCGWSNIEISKDDLKDFKVKIEQSAISQSVAREELVNQIEFYLDFFGKLAFFKANIVAVGANGSGKTSLAKTFKDHLSNMGVVISAQRMLVIPTFSGISNVDITLPKLRAAQVAEKSHRVTYSTDSKSGMYAAFGEIGNEFKFLLDNLLAERSAVRNRYLDVCRADSAHQGKPVTRLDKVLEIWNSLMLHRTIFCPDGINLVVSCADGSIYPAYQMSDGEKVVLFLVAQVIQAPEDGFIIIDEPEMYLHKTIVSRLWDVLEQVRKDCIFIYLTHDLDFAVNRLGATKLWVKSFVYPDQWEIESIPDNDLPESLLLELLGSRKDILFCEGKDKSLDIKIFSILFPQYTICPVESCADVIHHTKAFNRIANLSIKARGVIDRDHNPPERLEQLQRNKVFSFAMAEIENVFLDERFLLLAAGRLVKDVSVVTAIKEETLKKFAGDIDQQVSNYVSAKINYYFHESHVSKGHKLSEVQENYGRFVGQVDINGWYIEREKELNDILSSDDYVGVLRVYNNKGLKVVAQRHLGLTDFSGFSVRLLCEDVKAQEVVLDYFQELIGSK